jgi:hypothetical protein
MSKSDSIVTSLIKQTTTPQKKIFDKKEATLYQSFSGSNDLTVKRLQTLISTSVKTRKLKLAVLLSDYIDGKCTISWYKGEPWHHKLCED